MSGQIDVLAVMDEFALYVRNVSSRHALQGDILEARAAVAKLIEATKKMQRPLAELAHNAVDAEGMMSTRPITDFATGDVGPDYIAMACSALTESVAALARVGSTK